MGEKKKKWGCLRYYAYRAKMVFVKRFVRVQWTNLGWGGAAAPRPPSSPWLRNCNREL